MKKCLIFIFLLINIPSFSQDDQSIDSLAVQVLDRMAEFIGGMNSVSFTANITQDVDGSKFGLVKEFSRNEVYMVGPDKMHVQSIGTDGHRGYWYNGESLVYYANGIQNYFLENKIDATAIEGVVVSSVVPDLNEKFELVIQRLMNKNAIFLNIDNFPGLQVKTCLYPI